MPTDLPSSQADASPRTARPRLWPLYAILAIQIVALVLTITPSINNFLRFVVMMVVPLGAALALLIWLGAASRMRWFERVGLGLGSVLLGAVTAALVDQSMWTAMVIYGPVLLTVVVLAALHVVADRRPRTRLVTSLAAVACSWGIFTLGRLHGVDGQYLPDFRWRWTPTSEQLMASVERPRAAAPAVALILRDGDWPGFRGADRNGRVRNVALVTDWTTSAPRELWRVPIGPGWSSFAHVDGRLFTQEQRGEDEAVVCLDAATGAEVWTWRHPERFTEVVSGAGPRATPTFADGRIYATGAKGLLCCLDAADGRPLWQRDLMTELDAPLPVWGFAGSPLVVGSAVIVYAGASDGRGLIAVDAATGEDLWHAEGAGMNFGSAQPARIDGIDLVLFTNESGLLALDPASGELAWRIRPDGWRGVPIVQPQWLGGGSVIVPLGDGVGVARIEVERREDDWAITEQWSTRRLKPSFNDFVHHEEFIYGFDQSALTCIDVSTGGMKWRRGRYGFGQLVLVEDADALIVTAESGDVVLVAADPAGHRELGRLEALDGKTWNHPVLVGNRLFVRNGEEAVCYDLPVTPLDGVAD